MQKTDQPTRVQVPFANSGTRVTVPVASQIGITDGAISWTDGFVPLNMTPKASGGVPPSGTEMNGLLYQISANLLWSNAGGQPKRDSTYQTAIGGYPSGAVLQSSDGFGWWRSTADNNVTDPEAGGAGWDPVQSYGSLSITLSSSNVTVTAVQGLRRQIVLTGTLSANVNLVLPTKRCEWVVLNNTSGAYTITAKTSAGSGVALLAGVNFLVGDGSAIKHLQALQSSLSSNGYRITPDGLIEQWGKVAITAGSNVSINSFTFPIAFKTAVYSLTGNADKAANGGWNPVVCMFPDADRTLSGAKVIADTTNSGQALQSGITVNWRALGR